MLETPYTLVLDAEMLNAQLNFIKNNPAQESRTTYSIEKIYGKENDGIYNSYVKLFGESKPLRGRSEVIIFKGNEIFLHKKGNEYRFPGGTWDQSEDHKHTALREVKEEAKIVCKNLLYTESYVKMEPPKQWMKEKLPKEDWWYGYYTEVYIGTYDGKYTGIVNEVDRDHDMETKGRFYPIEEVRDLLSEVHIQIIDKYAQLPSKATEAIDFTEEPPLKTLFGAAINYVTVTTVRSLKKAIRKFIRDIKHGLNNEFTKVLVNIGVDSDACIDRKDITSFIRMEWDRIIALQSDINKELKIVKNGSMKRLRADTYNNLNMRARLIGANFQRWVKHAEEKEVTVGSVKDNINRFNRLIASLEVTERDITVLTNRIESAKLDEQTSRNISELLNIITFAINSYTLIVNELMKSIHPIHRLTSNTIEAVKKVNPKNWYDDDVDIKVFNSVYKKE